MLAGVLEEPLVTEREPACWEGNDASPKRKQSGQGWNASARVWMTLLFTVTVFALRLWWARQATFCGTPDSCFYLGLAQGIERTGSFHVNFVYDLLLPKLQLPTAGIEYWRPGTSFFLLLAHLFGSVTLGRGAMISTLAGVVWAASAWHIARQSTFTRRLALPAYMLALLLPPAWIDSLSTDSTLFYAMAVAWFLALFTVERQGLWHDVLALVCVAVAYLVRNDAVLLLAPFGVVLFLRGRRALRQRVLLSQASVPRGSSAVYAACLFAGFLIALLPMHAVYLRVLGTAMPGGTSQALWMNDLSDFNLYGSPLTARSLLAHGVFHLVAVRAQTALLIVYRVLALSLGYAALLFLPGLFRHPDERWSVSRRDAPNLSGLPELAGPLAFAATTLLVYSLLMPAIGVFSALRSAVGLLPWTAVLVMAGLQRAVEQERVRGWICAALLTAYGVSGAMDARRELATRNGLGDRDRKWAKQLEGMGARRETAVVMIGDPVQFSVTTGFAAVPVPGNGLDAVRREARALGVTHAMLDSNRLPGDGTDVASVLGAVRGVTLAEGHGTLLELDRRTR